MQTTLSSLACLVGSAVLGTFTVRAQTPPPAAPADAKEFGAQRPVAREALNVQRQEVWHMPAAPVQVFPLLCPTREYDWIPGWRAQLIHSTSGAAEQGCIFETRSPRDGRSTWVCTRYEPPTRIQYTIFQENGVLARLEITLVATTDGTDMTWTRTWHALDARGETSLQAWDDAAYQQMSRQLQLLLRHYLQTGTMLSPSRPHDIAD